MSVIINYEKHYLCLHKQIKNDERIILTTIALTLSFSSMDNYWRLSILFPRFIYFSMRATNKTQRVTATQ